MDEEEERARFDAIIADLKPQAWYIKVVVFVLIVLTICVVLVVAAALVALLAAAVYGVALLAIHVWEGLLR